MQSENVAVEEHDVEVDVDVVVEVDDMVVVSDSLSISSFRMVISMSV